MGAISVVEELVACRVGALIWIVVVSFVGWFREIERSSPDADRVYSDSEVEESKQMISLPSARSSL